MIVRFVNDSMHSRVSYMRQAMSCGASFLAVWPIRPVVKRAESAPLPGAKAV